MSATDAVSVTTVVKAPPERAFELFTREIHLWWRAQRRFGFDPERGGRPAFEGSGGARAPRRLVELFEDGSEPREVGLVRRWEPGERLVFGWRQEGFAADESTEVDIRFERAGDGTRVTVTHRGWDAFPADHPVRHGLAGPAFTFLVGGPWSEQVTAFGAWVSRR